MPTWYNAKVTIVTIDKNNPCIASVLCRGYCFNETAHVERVVDTFEVDDALSWGDNGIVGRIIGARRKHTSFDDIFSCNAAEGCLSQPHDLY